ncbi:MAG: hypothetical protein R3B13_15200 [Polyangiaceae bacterium]
MAGRAKAWSSRRSVVSWLLTTSAWLALGCKDTKPSEPQTQSPVFRIRSGSPPEEASRAGDAVWLVLASSGPKQRAKTIGLLRKALEEVEAAATPGLGGLVEQEAIEALGNARGHLLPRLTAARVLVRGHWAEKDLWVDPSSDGPGRKFRIWSEAEDTLVRRARMAAWPIAHAVRIRGLDESAARKVRDALADRADEASAPFSLIVTRDVDRRKHTAGDLDALIADCRRVQALVKRIERRNALTTVLGDLATVTTQPLLPWLDLAPSDVLVVPRLGALASRAQWIEELRAEVKSYAGATLDLD